MLSVVLLIISEKSYYLEELGSKAVDKNRKGDNNGYKCYLYSSVTVTLLNSCKKKRKPLLKLTP